MDRATKPSQAARQMTPQEQVQKTREQLRAAATGVVNALVDPKLTSATLGAALQAFVNAQQAWNTSIMTVPIALIAGDPPPAEDNRATDGGDENALSASHPAAAIVSANPRLWADRFLAENYNRGIDRESLVHWFGYAISAGAHSEVAASVLFEQARRASE